jgi:hypothetical protein
MSVTAHSIHGLWKAVENGVYQWGSYKVYQSTRGWDVWNWDKAHSKRIGSTDLMSEAMALAENHALQAQEG